MQKFGPSDLRDYGRGSMIEWVEADGVGGVSSSTIIGVNTRKQHAVLSAAGENGGRLVLVSNLQESVSDQGRSFDLSTNAYFGAIHPTGYESLESFTTSPWPTWVYRFDGLAGSAGASIEKQLVTIRGEHTVVAIYRLMGGERAVTLTVRPMLAFRDHNRVLLERGHNASNWQATTEFIECCPFEEGPPLFIAHPNAKIETVGLWYRGFIYQRDQEVHVECIEDLYNPGSLELSLPPNISRCLVFSTPSPRPVELVGEYVKNEKARRDRVCQAGPGDHASGDVFFRQLAEAADAFVYERLDGTAGVHPGLPFGECEPYRGLLAFPGLFLVTGHFELARKYLDRLGALWRDAGGPLRFCPQTVSGQMHAADVPLWLFVAAWRYWKASRDDDYAFGTLVPLLSEIAAYYGGGGGEVRTVGDGEKCGTPPTKRAGSAAGGRRNGGRFSGLLEVGHEAGARYAPHLPLGTNALWYNAQMILSEMTRRVNKRGAADWHRSAQIMVESLRRAFSCEQRSGLADAVRLEPFWRDETLRSSQVLSIGLPYTVAAEPASVLRLVERHLLTPYGLRTLAPEDGRYVGDGMDVKALPTSWSGSVDATWFGCYCDGLKRIGRFPSRELFEPFSAELARRGAGHLSGAYAGNSPHEPCGHVASASGAAEVLRAYARHVLRMQDIE